MYKYDSKIFKYLGSIPCLFELIYEPKIIKNNTKDLLLINLARFQMTDTFSRLKYLEKINNYLQYLVDNYKEEYAKELQIHCLTLVDVINIDIEHLNLNNVRFYIQTVLKSKVAIRENKGFLYKELFIGYGIWFNLRTQEFLTKIES